jgi:hypothetical protein
MANRIHLRITLILVVGLFLWSATAKTSVGFAQAIAQTPAQRAAQNPCADAQIVAAIQEKIKADHRFDDQWKHIHVSSRNRIVILTGWVKGPEQVQVLYRYARTTRCVRWREKLQHLRPYFSPGNCGIGQKPCGDICIDRRETCNLIQ